MRDETAAALADLPDNRKVGRFLSAPDAAVWNAAPVAAEDEPVTPGEAFRRWIHQTAKELDEVEPGWREQD